MLWLRVPRWNGGSDEFTTLCSRVGLGAANHHFGGFDERYGGVAGLEGEVAGAVGCDDGGDALIPDGEDYLGEQAVDDDLYDRADELVATADSSCGGMGRRRRGGTGQELVESFKGNAVVATGGFDGADATGEDPMLEGRVADADLVGGLTRREQDGRGHGVIEVPPSPVLYTFPQREGPGMGICRRTM